MYGDEVRKERIRKDIEDCCQVGLLSIVSYHMELKDHSLHRFSACQGSG